jgi:hypothetical protein
MTKIQNAELPPEVGQLGSSFFFGLLPILIIGNTSTTIHHYRGKKKSPNHHSQRFALTARTFGVKKGPFF